MVKFKDLPSEARSYIMMHTYASPLMVGGSALIAYLIIVGYEILQIGAIYTFVNVIVMFGPAITGRMLDRTMSAKKIMMLIYVLEGAGYFALFFACGSHTALVTTLALLIMKFSTIFYPAYNTYQHFAFSDEVRETALVYHLIVPEYTQIVAFPIFGFFLSYVFPTPAAYRALFLGVSLCSLMMAAYVLFRIKDIPRATFDLEKTEKREKLHRDFYLLFSAETCLNLAEAFISNLVIIYFVMVTLEQTFFMAMLLEVINSAVTIILGNSIKDIEIAQRVRLISSVFLFAVTQTLFIVAVYSRSIIPAIMAVITSTAGNVFWFPAHNTMLYESIPDSRRGEVFGAVSSFDRVIGMFTPLLAAALMSLSPYLPFAAALLIYAVSASGYIKITKA